MTQSTSASDAFNDSLNFVKKLWGQMGIPGMPAMSSMPGMTIPGMPAMPAPTMSVEELDKRIQELKAVETWLNVNMSMLRNTIQALEVQRGTIATLHSLSSTMAKTMQSFGAEAPKSSASATPASKPFTFSEKKPEPEVKKPSEAPQQAKPKAKVSTASADEVSPLLNQSAAWWQGLQDQFKLALGTALEKSAANYEAAKSASNTLAKAAAKASSIDAVAAMPLSGAAAKNGKAVKKPASRSRSVSAVSKTKTKTTARSRSQKT